MAAFPSGIATDALLLVGKDRAKSTLTSGIDDSTLTIPVADGTKFLANQVITIEDEQIRIASVAVNTITAAERGFAGTAAAAHLSGEDVRGHFTALHHNRLKDEVKAIEGRLFQTAINVKEAPYNAKGDGIADDTAAIQAAITAANCGGTGGACNGGEVYFPPGTYLISSLDVTNRWGIHLRGGIGSHGVTLSGSAQVTPGPCIDLTGSHSAKLSGLTIHGGTGVVPTSGYLLEGVSKISFYDVGSTGHFSAAALTLGFATNSNFYSCAWQNQHATAPVVDFNSATQFSNEITFVGCEFHSRFIDTTGTGAAWKISKLVNNLRAYACLFDTSGAANAYIQVDETSNRLLCSQCKFYSEGAGDPAYILRVASGKVAKSFTFDACANEPGSENLVFSADTGSAPGLRITGWWPARINTHTVLKGALVPGAAEHFYNIGQSNALGLAGGATTYLGTAGQAATAQNAQFRVQRNGVLAGLRMTSGTAPGGSETYTCTVMIDGVASALECVITGAATSNASSAVTHVTAGQYIAVRVVSSASAATTNSLIGQIGILWGEGN